MTDEWGFDYRKGTKIFTSVLRSVFGPYSKGAEWKVAAA